jgi:hypothetical protein
MMKKKGNRKEKGTEVNNGTVWKICWREKKDVEINGGIKVVGEKKEKAVRLELHGKEKNGKKRGSEKD